MLISIAAERSREKNLSPATISRKYTPQCAPTLGLKSGIHRERKAVSLAKFRLYQPQVM
jgi:hypothetical protein